MKINLIFSHLLRVRDMFYKLLSRTVDKIARPIRQMVGVSSNYDNGPPSVYFNRDKQLLIIGVPV